MMRTICTAVTATALAALAVGVAAPEAAGQDGDITSFGYSVSPKKVKAGGQVDLTVQDCTEHEATARSGIFDRTTLGMPGAVQSARVTVDWEAKPGAQYTVIFTCGKETGRSTITVSGTSSGSASPEPTSRPPQSGSTSRPRSSGSATPAAPGAGTRTTPAPSGTTRAPSGSTAAPAAPSGSATAQPAVPSAPARGGLGGSQGDGRYLVATGSALSSAALAVGVLTYCRRRADQRR
ncbi:hypothetical protein G5C51_11315 [Streptomyces sp. A7024]|uniref:Lipoprotein n=1 Tax=Streptomyces coryli TaxID=1128680 RepID=A0A6G4TY91_9ACTN|nr:hypothetical protein [Streptomyces coryli]NGN64490.1 hypothetical protein [Streptomyces coryli]